MTTTAHVPDTDPGDSDALARAVLDAADTLDVEKFVAFFSEDTKLRFNGGDPVLGKDGVRAAITGFWTAASVVGMRHEVIAVCTGPVGSEMIVSVEADVIYTRADKKVITVPVSSILRFTGQLIAEYRIYGDTSPVFA